MAASFDGLRDMCYCDMSLISLRPSPRYSLPSSLPAAYAYRQGPSEDHTALHGHHISSSPLPPPTFQDASGFNAPSLFPSTDGLFGLTYNNYNYTDSPGFQVPPGFREAWRFKTTNIVSVLIGWQTCWPARGCLFHLCRL